MFSPFIIFKFKSVVDVVSTRVINKYNFVFFPVILFLKLIETTEKLYINNFGIYLSALSETVERKEEKLYQLPSF
jgi:hypothetical protein